MRLRLPGTGTRGRNAVLAGSRALRVIRASSSRQEEGLDAVPGHLIPSAVSAVPGRGACFSVQEGVPCKGTVKSGTERCLAEGPRGGQGALFTVLHGLPVFLEVGASLVFFFK